MKIPTITGMIDRRILINFNADPDVIKQVVPAPFRPKIYKGKAIVGVCLIRLKNVRPKGFPEFIGLSSENGAHRIAVEWDENGQVREGVYIPRRDTSLRLNTIIGGRLFPGKHYFAKFNVKESEGSYSVNFKSSDQTSISIDAHETNNFPQNSVFENLDAASRFFENGSVGYSPNKNKFEGLKLRAYNWKVKPLAVINFHSSFFENYSLFPKGSIIFDNALLMTKIEHDWQSADNK